MVDKFTRSIKYEVSWYILFAESMVLVDETRREINMRLEIWREHLKSKGRTKKLYMDVSFLKAETMMYGL